MRLLWADGDWAVGHPEAAVPEQRGALVVDSFLARDGRVHDLDVHQERFARSCEALGLASGRARLDGFLAAARRALPARGKWFPRLEAHPGPPSRLVCWIRPAPPLSTQVRLWVHPDPDPRRRPRIKGPDLGLLADLREHARRQGADDAVLLAADGTVLETAHSALLWWRGDVLCHPDPVLPLLPSVTARRVLARAREEGVTVRPERCDWPALLDTEVWAVNALHGVRPVVGWRGLGRDAGARPADPRRLARFRHDVPTPSVVPRAGRR